MAKKQRQKRKPAKRGRKEVRLVITEDPQIALARLLKKPPPKRAE
jgi:hypothetical protein